MRINFTLTEDVDFSEGGLFFEAIDFSGSAHTVLLNIDLPAGLEGNIRSYNHITMQSNVGWSYRGDYHQYSIYNATMESSNSVVDMSVNADNVTANLRN